MAVTREYMQYLSKHFCQIEDIEGIARLLEISPLRLMQLRFEKPYFSFEIRKQKGKMRKLSRPRKNLSKC